MVANYCDQHVCLLAYLKNHMSKLHEIFYACYLRRLLYSSFTQCNILCRPTMHDAFAHCDNRKTLYGLKSEYFVYS